ncbi:hypothetical protein VTK26DRAFT_1761 [Humicola hyalothermophila]
MRLVRVAIPVNCIVGIVADRFVRLTVEFSEHNLNAEEAGYHGRIKRDPSCVLAMIGSPNVNSLVNNHDISAISGSMRPHVDSEFSLGLPAPLPLRNKV